MADATRPLRDFTKPYVCGMHGILDHPECVATKTPAQMVRRRFMVREAFRFLAARYGFKCFWCWHHGSKKERPLTVDHLIPLIKGGTNREDNLVLACLFCNNLKNDMLPDDPLWLSIVDRLRRGESYEWCKKIIDDQRVPLSLEKRCLEYEKKLIEKLKGSP